MIRHLFVIAVLLLCVFTTNAQKPKIEKSVAFDEPEYGWNKLLQLKNGNTFFFHSGKKDGLEVTVFDKNRKRIASKEIISKLWDSEKMKRCLIKGLYEINGQPVLFVIQANESQPGLYRMQLNPVNAAIVKEEKMGNLPHAKATSTFARSFTVSDKSDIFIEKDPGSDNYAVICFNTSARDNDERIKVSHYDGSHKLISTAFLESPDGQFENMEFIGAAVNGSKAVYIATYGYNKKADDPPSRVIISRLNGGDTAFLHKLLDFSTDLDETNSSMVFNSKDNKIQLLTVSYIKTKSKFFAEKSTDYYGVLYSIINPGTLDLVSVKPVIGQKITEYGARNFDADYQFNGLPENMILNNDNTTTLLFEEKHSVTSGGSSSHTSYYLGPVGIARMSNDGTEIKGYAINKSQSPKHNFPMFFMAQRAKGIFEFPHGVHLDGINDGFLSYDYVNAPHGHYVLFNDVARNFDKDEDESKRTTIKGVSATNTICFKLNDDKIDKWYLFGEPDDKHDAIFSYIESSHYNKETNCYATLIVERSGRDKECKIAWITFE